jgi:hypothetical protein
VPVGQGTSLLRFVTPILALIIGTRWLAHESCCTCFALSAKPCLFGCSTLAVGCWTALAKVALAALIQTLVLFAPRTGLALGTAAPWQFQFVADHSLSMRRAGQDKSCCLTFD